MFSQAEKGTHLQHAYVEGCWGIVGNNSRGRGLRRGGRKEHPGSENYDGFDNNTVGASTSCNTSSAQPQIAGAGIVVKDWFLANGYTNIATEGRLAAVLLAMTDRQGGSGKLTSGLDPKWGGGRFQARMLSSDLGAPWGWESWGGVVSSGQVSDHQMFGSGTEPSGIAQFKAYGWFFEGDYSAMANLNLRIMDTNCSGSTLASDFAYDVKMMAQIGSVAAGKALCVRRSGASVPSGGTRLLHHFAYFSGGTSMR